MWSISISYKRTRDSFLLFPISNSAIWIAELLLFATINYLLSKSDGFLWNFLPEGLNPQDSTLYCCWKAFLNSGELFDVYLEFPRIVSLIFTWFISNISKKSWIDFSIWCGLSGKSIILKAHSCYQWKSVHIDLLITLDERTSSSYVRIAVFFEFIHALPYPDPGDFEPEASSCTFLSNILS